MEDQLFSRTDRRDAAETAALLRSLADDLESGIGFDALAGEDVDLGVPTEMTVEFEVDRVTTETGEDERELEVELTWDPADEREADVAQTAGTDGPPTTDAADTPAGPTNAPGAVAGIDSQADFEVYRDKADEWRWRLRHRNGNIVADSGEGYARKRGAINGLESVQRNAPGADVEIDE
ncbi:HVO_2922 family protein [Halorientalis halophila]|uniref:HVO_2922 family protein n=1 Tax=Halorientalis halophila TaxID=3108499 RepID=UPI00300AE476